jgi:cytoskeleton protein RodZ
VVGKSLIEKREALGISLEEASSRTRIKLEFLQALEDETFHSLPDPVYLAGFLRRYAHFLGLDANDLVHEFQMQISEAVVSRVEPFKKAPPPARKVWTRPFVLVFALLLIPTAYLLSLSVVSSYRTSKVASVPFPAKEYPRQLPPLERERGQASSSEAGRLSSVKTQQDVHTLTLAAKERTWLMIQIDDGRPREILLLERQTLSLVARKRFRLTIGNAGGVQVILDGERFPLAGSSGQVIRDLVLPPGPEEG